MPSWSNEVKTAMDPGIHNVTAIQTRFLTEVIFKLLIDIFQYGSKTVEKPLTNFVVIYSHTSLIL